MFFLVNIAIIIMITLFMAKSSAHARAGFVRVCTTATLSFFPLTLLLSGSALAFSPPLVFSDSAQVSASKIYLDDLVANIGDNKILKDKITGVMVGVSPLPGKTKIIKKNDILRTLKRNGITEENTEIKIPEEITITRKAIVYGRKEIEALIRGELEKRNFVNKSGAAFSLFDVQKDVVLPFGKIVPMVKMPSQIKGLNMFWVSFYVDGQLKEKVWAKGTIKRFNEVLAVNKNISANEVISEDDLVYVKKNILDLDGNYLTNTKAAIGMKAVTNVSQGSILKKSSVEEQSSVKAGDMVSILATFKNMTISAVGKILSAQGSVGDTVTVLNVESKEKIQAVVLNEKSVKVEVQ